MRYSILQCINDYCLQDDKPTMYDEATPTDEVQPNSEYSQCNYVLSLLSLLVYSTPTPLTDSQTSIAIGN